MMHHATEMFVTDIIKRTILLNVPSDGLKTNDSTLSGNHTTKSYGPCQPYRNLNPTFNAPSLLLPRPLS